MLLFNRNEVPKKVSHLKHAYESLPTKFSHDQLHVRDYLGEGIYLLKNGDLGAIYRISGIYDEVLTNKELEQKIFTLQKGLRNICLGIPSFERKSNTVIQLHMRQREVTLDDVLDGRHNALKDDFLKKLILEEEKYHFQTQEMKKREFYLSLRFVVKNRERINYLEEVKNFIKKDIKTNDIQNTVKSNLKKFKEELSDLKHGLERDYTLEEVNSQDYISFVQNYFEINSKEKSLARDHDIHEQVIIPTLKLGEIDDDSTTRGVIESDKGWMKVFYFDQLSHLMYGQLRVFLDEIPVKNFDISWTISHGSCEYSSDLIAKEGWFERKGKDGDYIHFRENINSARPHVIQSIKLIVHNLKAEKEGRLKSITTDFLGCVLNKEIQIPISQFSSCLPLNCLPVDNKLKGGRCKQIRLENALGFAPIYDGAPRDFGCRNFISRQGTLTGFDFFSGQGNRMMATLADTRSGKSVFNAGNILEFMARYPDGIVRVIDKKSSYEKLGDLVGGRVIQFSEEALKDRPYSPFALESWDEDDIENIYLLIATTLVQKNKGINITACHAEVLRESIKLAYNSHLSNMKLAAKEGIEIDPHPVWNDILSKMPQVCENLRASNVVGVDEARDDLARWSVNLYPTGQYGFIFSRHEKNEANTNKERFLTYDLDGIHDEVLRQIAAMMAFVKIGRDLAKLPRSTPKLIVFEELGMLLHGEDEAQKLMDEFIHMVIKTCAKLNAVANSITNNVKDYTSPNKPAGITIWENSSQKVFLPLGDLIDSAKKAWGEKFNEADIQILEDVKKEFHLKRSQAYVYSNNDAAPYKGTVIVPLSPFMDALCTTSGPQVDLYHKYKKEGLDCMESLIKMATNNPYGEGL
jgi:hypothetical protein